MILILLFLNIILYNIINFIFSYEFIVSYSLWNSKDYIPKLCKLH